MLVNSQSFVADGPPLRLDRFLSQRCPDLSRTYVKKLVETGHVLVNGALARVSRNLKAGDVVFLVVPAPEEIELEAEDIPLDVVHEDQDMLVVDKPPGLPVHPAVGHPNHTLVNALLAHCPDLTGIGGKLRPGIVHRLDKDTSGLLMVAKNAKAHLSLTNQLKERTVKKGYITLVKGHPAVQEGTIEAPISRDPRNRKRMAVVGKGRESVTRYMVVEHLDDYSLLEVWPKTGRTHQIRVHLSHLGHPVVGDSLYGGKAPFLKRQFLHAHFLGFHHPADNRWLEFASSLPEDLKLALDVIPRP